MRSSIKLRSPLEMWDDDVLVFEPDKLPATCIAIAKMPLHVSETA